MLNTSPITSRRSVLLGIPSAAVCATLSKSAHAEDGNLFIKSFGAIGDGKADDTAALVEALGAIDSGQMLDLQGLHLNIFVGVSGASSGDALSLSSVPRLSGKKDIGIRNGKITADSPSVSRIKTRYPSTLTIDGCKNVSLENLVLHSKGESWGDTDASSGKNSEERREFAAQNGGHALLIVRSEDTTVVNCEMRLCGSVGSFYVMSSHNTRLIGCFSNPGSLGYAAYAFDSWAGHSSTSGFPAHTAVMIDCSAHREGCTYGSKGCVLTEDVDVSVAVDGGFFADAYPNGTARDLGYAFGCSSSRTTVSGAVVKNCASLGYTGTTTREDASQLIVSDVRAIGLRRTVHQTEATNVGRMTWHYRNVVAEVEGGGTWRDEANLARANTSYAAIMNLGSLIFGNFEECRLTGATYGFVNDTSVYGRLTFTDCFIETNGWLWSSRNIGSGRPGRGSARGIQFYNCEIVDNSTEQSAYTRTASELVYTYIDLQTSQIRLNSDRPLQESIIRKPEVFLEKVKFPDEVLVHP
jgi:hypothetical protein